MKKKRSTKKPVLNLAAAKQFAETPVKPLEGHNKPNVDVTLASAEKTPSAAPVEAKFRLTMNISKDVHLKLKLNAARQDTTMTKLIEKLVTENLDD